MYAVKPANKKSSSSPAAKASGKGKKDVARRKTQRHDTESLSDIVADAQKSASTDVPFTDISAPQSSGLATSSAATLAAPVAASSPPAPKAAPETARVSPPPPAATAPVTAPATPSERIKRPSPPDTKKTGAAQERSADAAPEPKTEVKALKPAIPVIEKPKASPGGKAAPEQEPKLQPEKKQDAATEPTAVTAGKTKETPSPSVEKEKVKAKAEAPVEVKSPAASSSGASPTAGAAGPAGEGKQSTAPAATGKTASGKANPGSAPATKTETPAVPETPKEAPSAKEPETKAEEKEAPAGAKGKKKEGKQGGQKGKKGRKGKGVGAKLRAAGAPALAAAQGRIKVLNENEKTHKPVDEKMGETKKAVIPPAEEAQSRSNAQQVETVGKKEAPKPSKEDAKSAMKSALRSATPDTLEEVDEFKSSGKAGDIRDSVLENVQGQVKGVQSTYAEIGNAPIAEPPPAEGPPIPEVELAPETPDLFLGEELVAKVSKEDTDMSEFADEIVRCREKEGVKEEDLRLVTSGPLAEATANTDSLNQKVATGPEELRKEEQKEKAAMQQELEADEQAARTTMEEGRKTQLDTVKGKQDEAKKTEEEKRQKVTDDIQAIYDTAKTSVDTKLANLETESLKRFDEGQQAASSKFEDTVNDDLEELKDERYSGALGWTNWLEDKLLGMDDLPEVKAIFDDAKDTFISEIDTLIADITKDANKVIEDCKKEIEDAKIEIKKYVDSLGPDLKKAAEDKAKEMTEKLDQLEQDVNKKAEELQNKLAERREQAIKAIEEKIEKMKEDLKGLAGMIGDLLLNAAMKLFEWALEAAGAPVQKILGSLKRAGGAFKTIIDDPIGFLGNLLSAMGKGFKQFSTNIITHLKQGLVGWLFGTMAKAGITMPTEFSIKAILGLVLQILGLTPEHLKKKAARYIGEENVERIMKVWEFISAFIKGGIGGLWELIKEHLTNLKEMVLGAIQDWLITQIIKQAVIWIVSLFNPVAAIIKAVQAIYKVVMFIIERIQQILEVMEAILGSLAEIASGAIGKAADWIEKTLGRLVPVVIGFLASLLGLGGISEKIREIVTKIQSKVDQAIDKVIAKVAAKIGKLFGKGKPDGAKDDPNKTPDEQAREQRKQEALAEVRAAMNKGIRRSALRKLVAGVKKKYQLKSAVLTAKDDVEITNSSKVAAKGKPVHVKHDLRVEDKESAEKPGRKKKVTEGGDLIGHFSAQTTNERTARGVLESYVEGEFPYSDMPSNALRPVKATAELYGKVSGIDRVASNPGLKNVNDFGRIESHLKGRDVFDYESGHLIANQFGGPDGFENLVPQRGNLVNRGVYRDIELWVGEKLNPMTGGAAEGQDINLIMSVRPQYGRKNYTISVSEAAERLGRQLRGRHGATEKLLKKAEGRKAAASSGTEEHEKETRAVKHWKTQLAAAEGKKELGEKFEKSAKGVKEEVTIPTRIPSSIKVDVTFDTTVDEKGNMASDGFKDREIEHKRSAKPGKASVTSSDPVIVSEGTPEPTQEGAAKREAGTAPKQKKVKAKKTFTVKEG